MQKVLITGCAGYIGSLLCHKLVDNYQVTGIDTMIYNQYKMLDKLPKNMVFHKADARLYKEYHKHDIIVNLAAYVGMPICSKLPEFEVQSVNTDLMRNIVEQASPNQTILYPNSNSSYGNAPNGVCTEESPLNPISIYAKTKDAAEESVLQHPNSIAFRLATVAGVSNRIRYDLMVNDFAYKAFHKLPIRIFEPQFRRNFVHVSDVVNCFAYAIENVDKMKQNVYNLGMDESNTTKEGLAQKACEIFDSTYEIVDGVDADQRNYEVSSKKLENVGFKAKINLEDTFYEWLYYFSLKFKQRFDWESNV